MGIIFCFENFQRERERQIVVQYTYNVQINIQYKIQRILKRETERKGDSQINV